jgi:hypothetical protein
MKLNFSKVLYGFIVAVLYLLIGTFTLLKFYIWQVTPDLSMLIFGTAVILYGLYRGYRSYMAYKTAKDEKD